MLHDLLNQTLDEIKSYSIDGYGSKMYTTLYTNIPCRWQERFEKVLDRSGEEVLSRIQCWILPVYNGQNIVIDIDYLFIFGGDEFTVISYINQYDINGNLQYIKVFLK